MRLNRYIASHTGISRRSADSAIESGRVSLNGTIASLGEQVTEGDKVEMDGQEVVPRPRSYYLLNKPVGYITSRAKQGKSPTIYELLPAELHHLKAVGRLDKDSCGLLLMTDDGELAQRLSHPKNGKIKTYLVRLDRQINDTDMKKIEQGVELEDGISRMRIKKHSTDLIVIKSPTLNGWQLVASNQSSSQAN
jgi:23S rRNA pseudouridine2605 synthase